MIATRHLAAILAADVVGYSRLIGADEEGTLNRLRSIRTHVVDPKITDRVHASTRIRQMALPFSST
jgi:adenylate cyclase